MSLIDHLNNVRSVFFPSDVQQNVEQASFSEMSKDELLSVMRSDWENMKDSQKEQLMQEIANVVAGERGIPSTPSVHVIHTSPNIYGSYGNGVININMDNIDNRNPYEIMDTLAHEINHAYQDYSKTMGTASGYSEEELTLMKAQGARGVYVSEGPMYNQQSNELDSNNIGLKFVTENNRMDAADKNLCEYIGRRQVYFERVCNDYRNHPEMCKNFEISQVQRALSMHVITPDEQQKAVDMIANNQNPIRQETENNYLMVQTISGQLEEANRMQSEGMIGSMTQSDDISFRNESVSQILSVPAEATADSTSSYGSDSFASSGNTSRQDNDASTSSGMGM